MADSRLVFSLVEFRGTFLYEGRREIHDSLSRSLRLFSVYPLPAADLVSLIHDRRLSLLWFYSVD